MGIFSSAALIFVALVAFGVGLWPVTLLASGYLAASAWRRTRRSHGAKDARVHRNLSALRYPAAGALLVLSLVAFTSGGVFSPLVLAGIAVLIMAQASLGYGRFAGRVKPVKNSILLRHILLPFEWAAVSEVKLGTSSPPRALSAIRDKLVLSCSGNPTAYVVLGTRAMTSGAAERKLVGRLSEIARILSPLGAYLLPLEASSAAISLSAPLERADIEPGDLLGRNPPPFDTLVLDSEEGKVARVGAYSKLDGSQDASIPVAFTTERQRPLLWELLEAIGDRVKWPQADACSSFLNSLQVTRREPIGERVSMVSQSPEVVQLEAAGGARVELSREQLRALMTIYA